MDEALLSISPRRGQLVKMLTTLELHACQHCLTTGMCINGFVEHQSTLELQLLHVSTLFDHWHVYPPFLMDEALLSISPAGRGQLVKMLTTLELHACQHCLTTGMCIRLF